MQWGELCSGLPPGAWSVPVLTARVLPGTPAACPEAGLGRGVLGSETRQGTPPEGVTSAAAAPHLNLTVVL